MIIECLAAFVIGFSNPADPTGKTMYTSGNRDCDNGFMNLPASKHPVLKISVPILDINGNTVNTGIYEAMLKEKQIFLIQAGEIIAVLPVTAIKSLPQKSNLTEAKANILDSDYVLVTFRESLIEAQAIVKISK
ncbi:MAG: hypothetical protein PHC34_10295 [Candidatus Gastranaerophilales bacterium]|nr:hypothetical protein [Candidatus Gastranaerophilales bacterium]